MPTAARAEGHLLGASLELGAPIPLVGAFRWGALAIGAVLTALDRHRPSTALLVWLVALAIYSGVRTIAPLRYGSRRSDHLAILAEIAIAAVAVGSSGGWSSPLAFLLITPVLAAGLCEGYGFAVRVAATSAAVVLVVRLPSLDRDTLGLREAAQWVAMLVLVAVVSGYARHISLINRAAANSSIAQLTEANSLLFSLHRVTQTLPASLDLEQVLTSAVESINAVTSSDGLAVILRDDTSDRWVPVRRDGCHTLAPARFNELPDQIQLVARGRSVVQVTGLDDMANPGITEGARCGIYGPLRVRGTVIGVIALESRQRDGLGSEAVEAISAILGPVALSIDNAQWFARLRTLGAEEERTRIARDLHDRIGQSLAYLGFELDRVRKAARSGDDVSEPLEHLRTDVTTVIAEVRDTLSDLRSDVDDEVSLPVALRDYTERVARRSGMRVELVDNERERLPLPQERELLRIAKEAIANAERHAKASTVVVRWSSDGRRAELTVSDDGVGIDPDTPPRPDAYGVVGMRERATSIGARLDLTSGTGKGTTVRVKVGG